MEFCNNVNSLQIGWESDYLVVESSDQEPGNDSGFETDDSGFETDDSGFGTDDDELVDISNPYESRFPLREIEGRR